MSRLAIVLAAGKGTRMKSDLPKVLCQAAGRPLIHYVLKALDAAGIDRTLVVIGYRGELVREALAGRKGVAFVEQTEQLGTGHAVQVCRDALDGHDGVVLVVTGDSPMIQADSIRTLLAEFETRRPACLMGTLHKDDPAGLGRIVRDTSGAFEAIVEEKDATESQRSVTEVNMSTYLFDCRELVAALGKLSRNNTQREYYLTDCPGILKAEGKVVEALATLKPCEALSINTVEDLAAVEAELKRMGEACAN